MYKEVQQDREVHTQYLQQTGLRKVQLIVQAAQRLQAKVTVPAHEAPHPVANHILQEAVQKAVAVTQVGAADVQPKAIQVEAVQDQAEVVTQAEAAHDLHEAAIQVEAAPGHQEAQVAQAAQVEAHPVADAKANI